MLDRAENERITYEKLASARLTLYFIDLARELAELGDLSIDYFRLFLAADVRRAMRIRGVSV